MRFIRNVAPWCISEVIRVVTGGVGVIIIRDRSSIGVVVVVNSVMVSVFEDVRVSLRVSSKGTIIISKVGCVVGITEGTL